MRDRDLQYRELRAAEKARYLAANAPVFPDAERRWRQYENLILDRFGPDRQFPPERRVRALDIAWANRDRHFQWASNKTNSGGPKKQPTAKPQREG